MPGPVEGATVKGGCTRWVMTFGEHRVDAYIRKGQIAVKTEEGWSGPDDCKPSAETGPPPGSAQAPAPREKESVKILDGRKGPEGRPDGRRKGSKVGFLPRRLQSMKAPAEFASEIAGKVTSLKVDGDSISGELTSAAALEMLTFGAHRREGGGLPEPANPRGSVKYWLKDGTLQKMEIHLAATLSLNGTDVPMDRTTIVEISNAGATQIEVPVEAQKLLETDSATPNPSPRPEKRPG